MTHRQESPRPRRVADRIQVELAELLQREVRDPRLARLSIIGVAVSRDLGAARVWVTGPFTQADETPVLEALRHAVPYLRTLLAPRLGLRTVPTLTFLVDHSLETGDRIERLLREIRDAEPPPE
jgi:ribosome-binding factor A